MNPTIRKSMFGAVLCAAALSAGPMLDAQTQTSAPRKTATESRLSQKYWELWRTGFAESEAGEAALIAGRNEEAAEHYKNALKIFTDVKANNPKWNKSVVNYRISLAGKRLNTALRRIEFQKGESASSAPAPAPADIGPVDTPPAMPENPAAEIEALRAALARSEKQNAPLRAEAEKGRLALQQIPGLIDDKKTAESKYNMLLLQYDELKKKTESAASGSAELEKAFKEEKFRSEALTAAVGDLRKEQETLRNDMRKLEAERAELAKTASEAKSLKEQTARTEKLLDEQRRKLGDLQKQSEKEAAEYKSKLGELSNKLADKTKENARLEKDLGAKLSLEETTRKIEENAASLRRENEKLKSDLASSLDDKARLDARLKKAETEAGERTRLISSLNSQVKDLTADLDKTSRRLSGETENAGKWKAAAEAAEAKNGELRKELAVLADRVNKIPAVSAGEEARKLQNELAIKKLNEENAALKKSLEEEKSKPAPKPEFIKVENPVNKELEAKVKALSDEAEKLKNALAGEKAKAPVPVPVENPVNKELEAKVKGLTAECEALKQAAKIAEEKAASGEKAAAAADQALEAKIKGMTAEMETLKKALESEKNKAPEKIQVENPVNKELEAKVREQSETLESIRKSMAEKETAAAGNVQRLNSEIEKLKDQCNQARTSAEKAASENTRLAGDNKTLTETNASLNAALKTVTDEKNKFGDENRKLNKDLLNIQALLEKAKLEAQDDSKVRAAEKTALEWQEKYEKSASSIDAVRKELDAKKSEAESLSKKITGLEAERDALQKRSQRMEARLNAWEKESSSIPKAELDKKNAVIDDLVAQQKKMSAEIDSLKNAVQEAETNASRYRKNLQTAREVTEKAMAESRRLRAELTMYRRNDPNPHPEVKAADAMPEELLVLSQGENDRHSRVQNADLSKYEASMKAAKESFDSKKYDDALWQYWAAADAAVNKPEPYIEISRIHAMQNNPEQGLKTYEKALKLGAARVPEIENTLKKQLAEKMKAGK